MQVGRKKVWKECRVLIGRRNDWKEEYEEDHQHPSLYDCTGYMFNVYKFLSASELFCPTKETAPS